MEHIDSPISRHMKREARQLRKLTPGLTQHQALDEIARRHGFECWRHFVNSEKNGTSRAPVVIQTVWDDCKGQTWREFIELNLTHHLAELFPRFGYTHTVWGKAWLDEGSNTVLIPSHYPYTNKTEAKRQSEARQHVLDIARYLMFMDATELFPSSAWQTFLKGFPQPYRDGVRLPCADHDKLWRDKEGRYLYTTEPYDYRRLDQWNQLQEIADARNHDLALVEWPGMHNPSITPGKGTRLILLSHRTRGVPLHDIQGKLSRLPVMYLPDQAWQGKTSPL